MTDKPIISTSANYHWVRSIKASSYNGLVLKLTICGHPDALDSQSNEAEINLYFDNDCRELVERLVATINNVDEPTTDAE